MIIGPAWNKYYGVPRPWPAQCVCQEVSTMQLKVISLLLAFGTLSQAAFNKGALNAFSHRHPSHYDQKRDFAPPAHPKLDKRRHSRFLNKHTEKFVVNGTGIPDVPFDIGESYAGLLPISQSPHEERQLYFWFFPTTNPDAGDEVVIW